MFIAYLHCSWYNKINFWKKKQIIEGSIRGLDVVLTWNYSWKLISSTQQILSLNIKPTLDFLIISIEILEIELLYKTYLIMIQLWEKKWAFVTLTWGICDIPNETALIQCWIAIKRVTYQWEVLKKSRVNA